MPQKFEKFAEVVVRRTGTKAELTSRVEHFLSGDVVFSSEKEIDFSSEEKKKISMTDTTLGLVVSTGTNSYTFLYTNVIGGFSFNAKWCVFFVVGCLVESNFKFKKEMAVAVREVKKTT